MIKKLLTIGLCLLCTFAAAQDSPLRIISVTADTNLFIGPAAISKAVLQPTSNAASVKVYDGATSVGTLKLIDVRGLDTNDGESKKWDGTVFCDSSFYIDLTNGTADIYIQDRDNKILIEHTDGTSVTLGGITFDTTGAVGLVSGKDALDYIARSDFRVKAVSTHTQTFTPTATATTIATVTPTATPVSPSVSIASVPSPASGYQPLSVAFVGSGTDTAGVITETRWYWENSTADDVSRTNSATVTSSVGHIYTATGTVSVRFEVLSSTGKVSNVTASVVVSATP